MHQHKIEAVQHQEGVDSPPRSRMMPLSDKYDAKQLF